MSHNVLRATFWFCTWWPRNTLGLNSTCRDVSFDISHDTFLVTYSFCNWWPRYTLRPDSTHRDLSFDMLHDIIWVTFWFCTQWPRFTLGLNSTHRDLPIHMLRDDLSEAFHFALNDPGIPLGWTLLIETFNLICHTIPFKSYFLFALDDPGTSSGWPLVIENFHLSHALKYRSMKFNTMLLLLKKFDGDSIHFLYTRNPLLKFLGITVAILKMAAILKLSKATKIVNNNYPLQSGHKITTTDQVSLRSNKKCQFTRGSVVKRSPF